MVFKAVVPCCCAGRAIGAGGVQCINGHAHRMPYEVTGGETRRFAPSIEEVLSFKSGSHYGRFDRFPGFPRPAPVYQFYLVQAVDSLSQGVIVTAPADRRVNAGLAQALSVAERGIPLTE